MDQDKRFYRQLKRVIKRKGTKHRRRDLKRALEANPAEAHWTNENLGKNTSADFNGLDQDATRRRDEEE
jgi:hypothetical protein